MLTGGFKKFSRNRRIFHGTSWSCTLDLEGYHWQWLRLVSVLGFRSIYAMVGILTMRITRKSLWKSSDWWSQVLSLLHPDASSTAPLQIPWVRRRKHLAVKKMNQDWFSPRRPSFNKHMMVEDIWLNNLGVQHYGLKALCNLKNFQDVGRNSDVISAC